MCSIMVTLVEERKWSKCGRGKRVGRKGFNPRFLTVGVVVEFNYLWGSIFVEALTHVQRAQGVAASIGDRLMPGASNAMRRLPWHSISISR